MPGHSAQFLTDSVLNSPLMVPTEALAQQGLIDPTNTAIATLFNHYKTKR